MLRQPLLPLAIVLMLGIVTADALSGTVGGRWLLPALMVLLVLSLLSALMLNSRHKMGSSACVHLAVFFFGAALMANSSDRVRFAFRKGQVVDYEAVVVSEPKVAGRTLRCDLCLMKVNGRMLRRPVKVKAAVLRDTVCNDWRQIRLGTGIAAVSPMEPLRNYHPGSTFDYVRWLKVHGFSAQTFIYYSDWELRSVTLRPLSRFGRLRLRAMMLRARVVNHFMQLTGTADDQSAAIVASMVLGDRHAVSRQTKELYSVTGASHVLALSGLHLGIIYAVLMLLFGRWRRHAWLSQALILSAIWTYVVQVGMGTSIMRSAVMLSIFSLCQVLHRDGASVNTLSFAAICLLVANPMSLWDISFQLSFLAVLAILIYYRPLYGMLRPRTRAGRALWSMIAVSLAAQAGTAPAVAYYFGRFSTYFLLTNLLVVPFATVIIYGSVVLAALTPWPAAAMLVASLLTRLARWLNLSLEWIASLPGACISSVTLSLLQVYLIYTALICLTVAFGRFPFRRPVNVRADNRRRQQKLIALLAGDTGGDAYASGTAVRQQAGDNSPEE